MHAPRSHAPETSREARELTPERWADFEGLFRKYHGVQAGCWCMFYHRDGPTGPLESASRQEQNRREHLRLLRAGGAHGILVYRGSQAVGWCQFGRREELPRIERGRKYRALRDRLGEPPAWRITCFFVDRPVRRPGVAGEALRAALRAIGRLGGGVVEAYPSTDPRAVATWFGSERMFAREGFRTVRRFGRSNVLVRRRVPGRAPPRRPATSPRGGRPPARARPRGRARRPGPAPSR